MLVLYKYLLAIKKVNIYIYIYIYIYLPIGIILSLLEV